MSASLYDPFAAYCSPPREHCQNGRSDICLAGSRDGVCCPEDSCDIDDEIRKDTPIPLEKLLARAALEAEHSTSEAAAVAEFKAALDKEKARDKYVTDSRAAFDKFEAGIEELKAKP